MQADTQKYSNSTVYIVIAFLAIFIIMPPVCRVLYAEEKVVDENTPTQVEALTSGKLICSKNFNSTGIEITSTATYEDGEIVTNVIELKNPKLLVNAEGLDETAQAEFSEYASLFSTFSSIPETNRIVNGSTTTVTIDKNVIEILGGNEDIDNLVQDSLSLQNSLEVNGYSCSIE